MVVADEADVADRACEALIEEGLARARAEHTRMLNKTCEECGDPAMILSNGVVARYCAPCWTDIQEDKVCNQLQH